jgi:hypothetical protein
VSKGEFGDEFELKGVDEQAESASGAEQPSAGEPEMTFEPIAEPEAQPTGISWEDAEVASPLGQGAETSSGAEISAEQFVSASEPEEPAAELSGAAEPMTAEPEAAGAEQEQAVAEGEVELEPVKLEQQAVEQQKKEEKEEEEEEKEARPSIFARMAEASPYTVLLGAAFVALVVGVVFLLLELKTYDFDIRAKKARQGVMDRPAAVSSYQSRIV